MLHKLFVATALTVVFVLALSITAFAQTAPGAGPDNPLIPDGTWKRLGIDEEHWYIFHEEGDAERVNVDMKMVPNAGVSFEVWTPDNLRDWAEEIDFDPVGTGTRSCGCEPSDELGKFNWSGSFVDAGDYYVVVKNEYEGTSYYTLAVSGKEVSLPLPAVAVAEPTAPVAPVEAAEPVAAAAPAPAEEAVSLLAHAGESPAYAMPLSQEWTTLPAGGIHWYEFVYDSDPDFRPLEVRAFADPPESAVVTVRNAEQANLWVSDGENEHFGCCTAVYTDREENKKEPFMRWAADNLASGQYYLVVDAAEGFTGDISYRLEILGEGVASAPMSREPISEAAAPAAVPVAEPTPGRFAAGEGSGPALAIPLTAEWMTLEQDQAQWYAFTYDSDEEYRPLEIRVYADPADAAEVTVRNAEQAGMWEADGTHEHFGCCTAVYTDREENKTEPFMRWTSGDLASGQYYVVVRLAEGVEGPATYRLEILGEGVTS